MDLLGIMARSNLKGALLIGGAKPDSNRIAKVLGINANEVDGLINELELNNVFSRLPNGTIINRRMYEEAELSRKRSEAGKTGASVRWQTNAIDDGKQMANENGNGVATLGNGNGIVNGNTKDHNVSTTIVEDVISYFNKVTGQNIRPKSKYVIDLIIPRVKEGFLLDEFKVVIDKKYAKWKDDPEMCEFIRPSTLFCRKHFEEYLNQKVTHKETAEEYRKRQDEALHSGEPSDWIKKQIAAGEDVNYDPAKGDDE